MSMVIEHGFRLRTSDLGVIWRAIGGFQATVKPLADDIRGEWMARRACEIMDRCTVAGQSLGSDSPLSRVWSEVTERMNKVQRTQERDPSIDVSLRLYVIPRLGEMPLGLIHTEHAALTEPWFELPIVERYAYWNNTDHPDDVTYSEWRARDRAWNAAFGTHRTYGMSALSIECVSSLLPEPEHVLAHVPSLDTRARRLAWDQLVSERMEGIPNESQGKRLFEEAFEAYTETVEWLKTPEGETKLAGRMSTIAPLLAPATAATLLGPDHPLALRNRTSGRP